MLQEQLAQHDLQIPLELQAQTVLLKQPVLQVPLVWLEQLEQLMLQVQPVLLVQLELRVQWLQVRPE